MKSGALFLALLLLLSHSVLASLPQMPEQGSLIRALCVKVVDGDTAWFEPVGGEVVHKVRFIGIDTPETVHPTREVQPFGQEASDYTTASLLDQHVYLEADIEETDRYGRHLFYIWLEDGILFNLTLLQQGYATITTYPPNLKYVDFFIPAQESARENGLGLWSGSVYEDSNFEEVTP